MAGFSGSLEGPNATTAYAANRNPLTSDYIVSGPTTTLNGVTNFTPFGSSSALNLTLTGATTNIVMMIAGKRYVIAGALVVALTDASWNFVYYDGDTGALGTVTVAPRYWGEAPSHATGQHWFDMNTGLMKLSDGVSTWTAKNRIFLGCWRADTTINAVYAADKIGCTVEKRVAEFGSGADGMLDTNNTNTTLASGSANMQYSFIGQRGTSSIVHTAASSSIQPSVRCQGYTLNIGSGGVLLDGLGGAAGAGGASANGAAGGGGTFGGGGGGGGGSSGQTGGAGGAVNVAFRTLIASGSAAGASGGGAGTAGSASGWVSSAGRGDAGYSATGYGGGGAGGGGTGATGASGGAGGGRIDLHLYSVAMGASAIMSANGVAGTAGPAADRGAGGGGGGGRCRLRYGNLYDNNGTTFTAAGGAGGAGAAPGTTSGNGGAGGAGVFELKRVH